MSSDMCSGDLSVIKFLINEGADVNKPDRVST